MARNNRSARSKAGYGEPLQSTVRSKVVGQEVPTIKSDMAGLEGLNKALDTFFTRTVSAMDNVSAALTARNKADISIENEQQKAEGVALAYADQDLTPEQQADLDFVNAHKVTRASIMAGDLATKFEKELSELPVADDGRTFYDEFVKRELKNGDRLGTGDSLFDATLLSNLEKRSAPLIHNHMVAGIKAQKWQAEQEFSASVSRSVDGMEPTDLIEAFGRARDLHPLDPDKAAPTVINALIAGVGNDPRKAQRVLNLLQAPHTGTNGLSYAQSFPEGFREAEEKMVAAYTTGHTFAGEADYEEARRLIDETSDPARLAMIALPGGVLDKLRNVHGQQGQYDALSKTVHTKLAKLGVELTEINQVEAMARSGAPFDQSLWNKRFGDLLKRYQLDPFQNPEGVAEVAARGRNTIPQDLVKDYSAALTNLGENNVERFNASLKFYMAIENRAGEDTALEMMTTDAKPMYLHAKRQFMMDPRPAQEILADMKANQGSIEIAAKTSWKHIQKASGTVDEAEAAVNKEIESALSEAVGETVSVSQTVLRDVREFAKDVIFKRDSSGNTDWKQAVKDSVKSMSDNLTLFPGENGKIMASRTLIPSQRLVNGKPVPVVRFGTNVLNPDTGERENTIDTARDDVKVLSNVLSGNVLGGGEISDAKAFAFNGRSAFAPKGIWVLEHKSQPIVIGLGETVKINGEEFKLPTDPVAAENMVKELKFVKPVSPDMPVPEWLKAMRDLTINERLQLIPVPADGSAGFMIGYTPGFKNKLQSFEDRLNNFSAIKEADMLKEGEAIDPVDRMRRRVKGK